MASRASARCSARPMAARAGARAGCPKACATATRSPAGKADEARPSPSPAPRERVASPKGEPGEGCMRLKTLTRLRAPPSGTLSRSAGEGLFVLLARLPLGDRLGEGGGAAGLLDVQ